MKSHFYVCEYCSIAYKPKKRGTQKYCSTSCRVGAFKLKNKKNQFSDQSSETHSEIGENQDTINAAGIGNAALGTALVEGAKHFLTHPDNRPATKRDLDRLHLSLKSRYQPIINLAQNDRGAKPFYDNLKQILIYI